MLGFIQEASGVLLIGRTQALSIAGGLLGITDLYNAGKRILNGEGSFWDWLEVGATLAGPVAGVAFKAFKWARKLASASRISRNSKTWKRLGCARKALTCFVAGTLIATPDGQVPIDQLKIGDEVVTRDEHCADGFVTTGRVTAVFRSLQSQTLWIEFSNGVVLGTTPPHEFYTPDRGWIAAEDLIVGDTVADGLNLSQSIVVSDNSEECSMANETIIVTG